MRKDGINIVIFQKKIKIIRKTLEKEKIKESYYIVCQNSENINDLKNPTRETGFIIKESKNYYPIILVQKDSEDSKDITTKKTFKYLPEPKNIINHIFKYYNINCQSEYRVLIKDNNIGSYTAKETKQILTELGKKEYLPKTQIIDTRFKCKFLVTYGGHIIPTMPSGTIYNLSITHNIDNYVQSYAATFKYLNEIYQLTNKVLKVKPVGIFYRDKKEKTYYVTAIMTENYDAVPVETKIMNSETIKKEKLLVQNKPNDDAIDREIIKGPSNIVVDNRVYYVSKNKYETELYQLFRYHMSYYLNNVIPGMNYKTQLVKLINDSGISKRERKIKIKELLYKMTNQDLSKTFSELLKRKSTGGNNINPYAQAKYPISIADTDTKTIELIPDISDPAISGSIDVPDVAEFDYSEQILPLNTPFEFVKGEPPKLQNAYFPENEKNWLHVLPNNKNIDYPNFVVKNNRELCYNNNTKDSCNDNQHCYWNNSKNMCMLSVKQDLLVNFINKISEEFVQNELKAHEILRNDDYFVSDIVDYNVFTERPGEKIIMSSNTNLNKILSEIFGKENIPRIGKRRNKIESLQNYEQLNLDNPLRDINNWYLQNIIENNNTIYRAFANSYYWLMHPYNDTNARNLGYYSNLQTSLSNMYKSQVIDWLLNKENEADIQKILPYIKYGRVLDFATKLSTDIYTLTNCIVELYILSKLYDTIIYVNDDNYNIIYAIHPTNGVIFDHKKDKKQIDISKYQNFKKIINLRFHYFSKNPAPDRIEVMYPKKN